MTAESWVDEDLSPQALAEALGGRPFRTYPALLSTEADALAWARAGGPHGAVVVAAYQASPRGRAGLPWSVPSTGALAFSMILRPGLEPDREGWLYPVALAAVRDVRGEDCTVAWPDTVERGDHVIGRIGVQTEAQPDAVEWAVLSVLALEAAPPRGPLLATLADAVQARSAQAAEQLLAALNESCTTIGRTVRARLIPLGPSGIVVEGTALELNDDGSLVVETDAGRRQRVRPQDLGVLDLP